MIDVVVPVYRDEALTRACLESVFASRRHCRHPFEVVVVNDCSPEPALATWLDELADENRITLIRHPQNLGFVRSVNEGMSLHPQRDVVLLNSDTEVANDWLDRLHAAACAEDNIGTVTPFSNNATICSYPFIGWEGALPGGLGLAALDAACADLNPGCRVDLPTGVGFCMYLRRRCLDEVGLFDADRFGRGYGEENDFCMRAAGLGWRSVLAGDVFVMHAGGASFSEEKEQLVARAQEILNQSYPQYPLLVRDFILDDPVRPLRERVDDWRIAHGEAAEVAEERAAELLWWRHWTSGLLAQESACREGPVLDNDALSAGAALGRLLEVLARRLDHQPRWLRAVGCPSASGLRRLAARLRSARN